MSVPGVRRQPRFIPQPAGSVILSRAASDGCGMSGSTRKLHNNTASAGLTSSLAPPSRYPLWQIAGPTRGQGRGGGADPS